MNKWLIRKTLVSIFPPSGELPGLSAETGLDAFLDQFNREAPIPMRVALLAACTAYNVATPLTIGIPFPAILLPQHLLDKHAHRAALHKIYLLRQIVLLLKTVGGMCWGADTTVREKFNLDAYPDDPSSWRHK